MSAADDVLAGFNMAQAGKEKREKNDAMKRKMGAMQSAIDVVKKPDETPIQQTQQPGAMTRVYQKMVG